MSTWVQLPECDCLSKCFVLIKYEFINFVNIDLGYT